MYSRINFPVECFEDICHHLNGSDLLKCTRVSPYWNELVGTTKSFTKKVKLSCRFNVNDNLLKRILMNSQRRYEKVNLEGCYSEGYQMLSLDGKTLTHIITRDLNFATVDHFLDFLWIFQSSAEKMVLHLGKVNEKRKINDESANLEVPNHNDSNKSVNFASLFDKAFADCKNLKSLTIEMFEKSPSASEAIRTTLKSSNGLKKLEIKCDSLFSEDFSSEVNFKLEKIHFYSLVRSEAVFQQNVNLFLITQRETLESVIFAGSMGVDAMRTILSMPRLKTLTFGVNDIDPEELATANLPQNQSVANLHLTGNWHRKASAYKVLLKAFPNVESLRILKLTDDLADLIPEACKSLKKLTVMQFEAESIKNEKFYLKLLTFTSCLVKPTSQELFEKLNKNVNGNFKASMEFYKRSYN